MKLINLALSNSIVGEYMAQLRDKNIQQSRMLFRRNICRIGSIMAYEISKTLRYSTKDIVTPLGIAPTATPDDDIILATVLRAGLPFHQGFLDVFDKADCAFVSAYRYYKDEKHKEIGACSEYLASSCIQGKTLIIADPMLATGGSLRLSYEALRTHGTPATLHLCCVIAAQRGVDYIQDTFSDIPDATLWCAAIDPELNEDAYITPGLGDAGDLAFGTKLSTGTHD